MWAWRVQQMTASQPPCSKKTSGGRWLQKRWRPRTAGAGASCFSVLLVKLGGSAGPASQLEGRLQTCGLWRFTKWQSPGERGGVQGTGDWEGGGSWGKQDSDSWQGRDCHQKLRERIRHFWPLGMVSFCHLTSLSLRFALWTEAGIGLRFH